MSAPALSGCTPALAAPLTLGPGASQTYVCPNVTVLSPVGATATATAQLSVSNVAYAFHPDDPGGLKSSGPVQNQIVVTGSDHFTVIFSDYFYIHLPLVAR